MMNDTELREQELQRLYRCVFYDKQDGVDREAMFIKEVGVVVDKLVADREKAIEQRGFNKGYSECMKEWQTS